MFVKEAHAIALFPGGYGTHDEALEALTLMQTGKGEMLPVVFVDEPGGSYWREWCRLGCAPTWRRGDSSSESKTCNLFKVTDDVDGAVHEILNFYSNYHSSRYVGDQLVLRVREAPDGEELERLNGDFQHILKKGEIDVRDALPKEKGKVPGLPRVVLHFDRRSHGGLRLLIDRLNELVSVSASLPRDASAHEILSIEMSERAEHEEQAED